MSCGTCLYQSRTDSIVRDTDVFSRNRVLQDLNVGVAIELAKRTDASQGAVFKPTGIKTESGCVGWPRRVKSTVQRNPIVANADVDPGVPAPDSPQRRQSPCASETGCPPRASVLRAASSIRSKPRAGSGRLPMPARWQCPNRIACVGWSIVAAHAPLSRRRVVAYHLPGNGLDSWIVRLQERVGGQERIELRLIHAGQLLRTFGFGDALPGSRSLESFRLRAGFRFPGRAIRVPAAFV